MNARLPYLRSKASKLGLLPGVYLMKNVRDEIIYIGKAKRLKNRVSSYFRDGAEHNPKVQSMVDHVFDFEFIVTASEFEALVLECSLIKQHKPKYNILLKDDKGYHYIHITDEEYPRIECTTDNKEGGRYLGPYMSAVVVKETVDEVNKVFKLPTCNKKFPQDFGKQRPCLNFQIKNCSGICNGYMNKTEYNRIINDAIDYIKTGSRDSIIALTEQMTTAANNLEFEKAAVLRDRIRAIQKSVEQQKVIINSANSMDVIGGAKYDNGVYITVVKYREAKLFDKLAFDINSADTDIIEQFIVQFYNSNEIPNKILLSKVAFESQKALEDFLTHKSGNNIGRNRIMEATSEQEKSLVQLAVNNSREYAVLKLKTMNSEQAALEQLRKILGLKAVPNYIEAFDISNLGNQSIVAGEVVFEGGKPLRQAYRKYSLTAQLLQNDYKSMNDVIEKRIQRLLDTSEQPNSWAQYNRRKPDLLLVDGGKQHVAVAKKVLEKYNIDIPVFGMVKDGKHKTKTLTTDTCELDINKITESAAFRLLEHIQNEVHRYSVEFMHKVHRQDITRSDLQNIHGVGQKKSDALLTHFKTIGNIREASIDELTQVDGISVRIAKQIYNYLH